MRRLMTLTAFFLLGMTRLALAGPLGLDFGMTPDAVKALVGPSAVARASADEIVLRTVPAPDFRFERYTLSFSPKGLGRIVARGKGIVAEPDGGAVKAQFVAASAQLTDAHGSPTEQVDKISPSSTLTGPNGWLESIARRQRTVKTEWLMKEDSKGVTGTASLEVKAFSSEVGSLELKYESTDWKEYMKAGGGGIRSLSGH